MDNSISYNYDLPVPVTYPMSSGSRRGAIVAFETTSRHLCLSPVELTDSQALKLHLYITIKNRRTSP